MQKLHSNQTRHVRSIARHLLVRSTVLKLRGQAQHLKPNLLLLTRSNLQMGSMCRPLHWPASTTQLSRSYSIPKEHKEIYALTRSSRGSGFGADYRIKSRFHTRTSLAGNHCTSMASQLHNTPLLCTTSKPSPICEPTHSLFDC